MSFKDNISAFTKGVGQKAKGNYDIVTMNSQISTLAKQIKTLHEQIGAVYCNMHKDDAEEAFSGMVENIKKLEAQMLDIQQQIEATRAATAAVSLSAPPSPKVPTGDGSNGFCESCGAALPAQSMFCVNCGAKVPQKEQEQDSAGTDRSAAEQEE